MNSGSARRPRHRNGGHRRQDIIFEIDAENRLSAVSPSWDRFAADNGAAELAIAKIRDRLIFDFIADAETREIQRLILDQARRSAHALRYTIRCDSPTHLRRLQLVVSSPDRRSVRTESRLLRLEQQRSGSLLARGVERSGEMLRICSWCCRSRVGSEWLDPAEIAERLGLFESNSAPQLTHGMCERCLDRAASLLR